MFGKSYHRIKRSQKISLGLFIAIAVAGIFGSKMLQSYQILNIDSSLHGTICFSFGDIIVIKHFD